MGEPTGVDAIWFAMHRADTHRIRSATEDEAATFDIVKPGFDNLLTVVRRADGARVTFASTPGDDIVRACDFELAGWFDDDRDRSATHHG